MKRIWNDLKQYWSNIFWIFITVLLASCLANLLTGCTAIPTQPPTQSPPPKATPEPERVRTALEWKNAEWDKTLREAIAAEWATLSKAKDMATFCPKYAELSTADKQEAFAHFMVAVAKPESGYDPKKRYWETTMSKYSEGLFQMSVPECGLTKVTILQGSPNIRCAVTWMGKVVKNTGIVQAKPPRAYWAVIIPGGKYQKIAQIAAQTKKYSKCN